MRNTIHSIIPDPEVLLSLEPEELAGLVLEYLNSAGPQELNRYNFSLPHTVEEYPQKYRDRISEALMEAWIWLEREGLIAPTPGQPDDWIFITRRGKRIKNRSGFESYRNTQILPKQLLHPIIAQKIWSLFLRGEYDTAVFQAFKEIEVRVRETSGLSLQDLGTNLMRKAFDPKNGPLSDMTTLKGEREALSNLFAGAIGSYKNPNSHRKVKIESIEATEMIILASHLMKIVDSRDKSLR